MRLGALLNDAQNRGMSPILVAGGKIAPELAGERRILRPWIRGAGRLVLELTAPCGGSSGFLNDGGRVAGTAVAVRLAMVALRRSRRDLGFMTHPRHPFERLHNRGPIAIRIST